jgi:hypothetical protein
MYRTIDVYVGFPEVLRSEVTSYVYITAFLEDRDHSRSLDSPTVYVTHM